jgi:hypothetical protein
MMLTVALLSLTARSISLPWVRETGTFASRGLVGLAIAKEV